MLQRNERQLRAEAMIARTSKTQDLEQYSLQWYQYYFLDKFPFKECTRRMDLLLSLHGKTYHVT